MNKGVCKAGTQTCNAQGTAFGACPAAEIVLFESTLTPRGAIYRAVARQTL
jgi:2'-5' RNA ligase